MPAQDTQEIVGGGPAEHVGFVIILQECVEFRLPHGYVQVADEVFSVSIRDRSGPQALWKAVRRNVDVGFFFCFQTVPDLLPGIGEECFPHAGGLTGGLFDFVHIGGARGSAQAAQLILQETGHALVQPRLPVLVVPHGGVEPLVADFMGDIVLDCVEVTGRPGFGQIFLGSVDHDKTRIFHAAEPESEDSFRDIQLVIRIRTDVFRVQFDAVPGHHAADFPIQIHVLRLSVTVREPVVVHGDALYGEGVLPECVAGDNGQVPDIPGLDGGDAVFCFTAAGGRHPVGCRRPEGDVVIRHGAVPVLAVVIVRVVNPFPVLVVAEVREAEGEVVDRSFLSQSGIAEPVFPFRHGSGDFHSDVQGTACRNGPVAQRNGQHAGILRILPVTEGRFSGGNGSDGGFRTFRHISPVVLPVVPEVSVSDVHDA